MYKLVSDAAHSLCDAKYQHIPDPEFDEFHMEILLKNLSYIEDAAKTIRKNIEKIK